MNTITILIKSQLTRLWRSKALLVVALIGPLLAMLLAGLAFNNSSGFGLKVGAYVPEPSDLSTSIISSLATNKVLVQPYTAESDCINAVRSGERHACMVFSQPFGVSATNNTIDIVIDGSNLALAGLLSEGLYGNIENQSTALSTDLAKQLVSAIDTIRKRTQEGKLTIVSIATSTNAALQNTKSSQGSVNALDTTFAVSDVDVGTVGDQTGVLVNVTQVAIVNTSTLLYGILNTIVNATTYNQSNVTNNMTGPQKALLTSQYANVSAAVNASLVLLQQLNVSVTVGGMNLAASVVAVNTQLAAVKTKVDAIVQAKSAVYGNLAGIEGKLNQALVDITTVQQTFDAIDSAVSSVTVTDPSRVSKPIRAVVQPLQVASHLAPIYPAMLVLVVAFGGLLIAPRLVHMEERSGAQLRMSLIAGHRETLAMATIATGAILVAAQAIVLVLVSSIIFSQVGAVSTIVVLVLAGVLFVMLGNAISYFFSTEEAAMLATLTVGMVLLILSGIIIPVEYMPPSLQSIAAYNPILIAASVVRQTAVFGVSVFQASGILSVIGGIIVAALLAYGALVLSRRYTIERLLQRK